MNNKNQGFATYLDFELEIGPGHRREYPVAVTHSPAGEAHATMRFPYDELTLEKRLVVLQNALLGSGGGPRQVLSPEVLVVRDFGRDLFDALFTGEVRCCYEQSIEQASREDKGIRLKLRFEPADLAAVPWEYLYDPRRAEYVCLSRTTPLVRYVELPRTIPPPSLSPPLRVLGMIASHGDMESPEAAHEKERMETALEGLQARGLAELTWVEGQTWDHLQEAMQRGAWHAIHFLGYGSFSRRDLRVDQLSDKGLVARTDEENEARRLNAAGLARLLADHRSLHVALLSAREGARGAQTSRKATPRNVFTSTASLLVQQGIPAVLTMPYEMTDEASIELFRAFYEALALGTPVDAALAAARQAISFAAANSVEWGAPALFMGSPVGLVPSPGVGLRPDRAQVIEEPRRVSARRETPAEVMEPAPAAPPQEVVKPHRERAPEREIPIRTPQPTKPEPAPAAPPQEVVKPRRERAPEREIPIRTPQPIEPEPAPAAPPQEVVKPRRVRAPKRKIPIRTPQPIEPEMVLIPASEFLMGSDPEQDERAYEAEQPQHRVLLPDYHIARTPTTNAQYAAFVEASGHKAPHHWVDGKSPGGKEDYPVAYISWYDAMAYCKWLTEKKGQVYRLPSEAEWEKAARGTDGDIYPWGDVWDSDYCNSKESGPDDVTLVHTYPNGASPYDILDMAGNVWEWTGSLYRPYPYDPKDGREDLRAFGKRVLRSGAFYSTARRVRCAYRDSGYADDSHGSYGFRVVLAPG